MFARQKPREIVPILLMPMLVKIAVGATVGRPPFVGAIHESPVFLYSYLQREQAPALPQAVAFAARFFRYCNYFASSLIILRMTGTLSITPETTIVSASSGARYWPL